MFHICHDFLSVQYSFVVTCWERVNLLALLSVVFCCVLKKLNFDLIHLRQGVEGQLREKYLLPCCCIRDSIKFVMRYDLFLKK